MTNLLFILYFVDQILFNTIYASDVADARLFHISDIDGLSIQVGHT